MQFKLNLNRRIIIGVLLFLGSLLMSWSTGGLNLDFQCIQPLTLAIVAIIFVCYGVTVDAFLPRFERSE